MSAAAKGSEIWATIPHSSENKNAHINSMQKWESREFRSVYFQSNSYKPNVQFYIVWAFFKK